MTRYIIRLDDASEYMDVINWKKMKDILDRYHIKPIFGIIPDNQDKSLIEVYQKDENFWSEMRSWISEDWIPALHGFEHRYVTESGGCNPVNARSEFAGLPYEEQARKIRLGHRILKEQGINPEIFFAPSHTFDENTLLALKNETEIRVVSDTIANDIYKKDDLWFVPQQSGCVRALPFKTVTFCYHPNTMKKQDFDILETFLQKNQEKFIKFSKDMLSDRQLTFFDKALRWLYFAKRRM